MNVYCFDRDLTVSTNEGPVPLAVVQYLAYETEHQVWAIGNQHLKQEAGIPGVQEAKELLETFVFPGQAPETDSPVTYKPIRREGIRLVKDVYSVSNQSVEEFVVVDDVDLTGLEREGWTYYKPEEFPLSDTGSAPGISLETLTHHEWGLSPKEKKEEYFERLNS